VPDSVRANDQWIRRSTDAVDKGRLKCGISSSGLVDSNITGRRQLVPQTVPLAGAGALPDDLATAHGIGRRGRGRGATRAGDFIHYPGAEIRRLKPSLIN
jgi:hypothetical protein